MTHILARIWATRGPAPTMPVTPVGVWVQMPLTHREPPGWYWRSRAKWGRRISCLTGRVLTPLEKAGQTGLFW